ncbi:LigB subunit of an aromatic-ring-opening dioxygenase LigAB [Coniochaeta ligniaria NRRL 30616]|uniref:LigB subunit of an aromatic-ring-opening dioxygenase LigAB n=1 Tax=Coniochaeta ligniaria NRRL 30616 TaxID=1408157 RepID=A0A1J7J163_9PEZI|nr:LigB subunit of an aromatic-ring-opening dioxygenase LigAB [Coniochaeta ligniaria NRRL 30616]
MPSATQPAQRLPVYFIGHAGVNLLFSETENNKIVQNNLRAIGDEIRAISPPPKAIITFSGHFEAGEIHGPGVIEVNVKKGTYIQHDFVNDFYDSRPSVYDYDWPHQDAPDLALEVWSHLQKSGFKAKRVARGVDHGVWVPFKVMFPPEKPLDVPIVQVSTFHGYDLASQIRLGQAFRTLRDQGYLVVASGMAVHSFASIGEIQRAVSDEERQAVRDKVLAESRTFDTELRKAVTKQDAAERKAALLKLEKLYEFRRSHPTVEHLTPIFVAAGAAGDAEVQVALECRGAQLERALIFLICLHSGPHARTLACSNVNTRLTRYSVIIVPPFLDEPGCLDAWDEYARAFGN